MYRRIIMGIFCLLLLYGKAYADDLGVVGVKDVHKKLPKMMKYAGADVEKVVLYSQPGMSGAKKLVLNGLLFRRPGAKAVVLMCHGFMCNTTDVLCLSSIFKNYHVLVFDFRGHGEGATQQCCTFGHDEAYDVLSAVEFIKADKDLNRLPLIVWAFSMGAVAAIRAEKEFGPLFDLSIYDCPFDSTSELLARCISNLRLNLLGYNFALPGRKFLKKYAYNRYVQSLLKMALKTVANMDSMNIETRMVPVDTVANASAIVSPTFFIVCKNDQKAPPIAVERIFHAATKSPIKILWESNGRRHFDTYFYKPQEYDYRVNRFIEKFLSGALLKKKPEKVIYDSEEREK